MIRVCEEEESAGVNLKKIRVVFVFPCSGITVLVNRLLFILLIKSTRYHAESE